MVSDIIQLIIRSDEHDRNVYATSPQAPGLLYGHNSLKELQQGLQDVLSFHFDTQGPFSVQEHHERHYEFPDGELVTRMAVDEHRVERQHTYSTLGAVVSVPAQARGLLAAPQNSVGEVVYICAVPTDTLGWVLAQFDRRGDVANVAVSVAGMMIVTFPMAYGEQHAGEDMVSIAERDYTLDTQLSKIVQDIQIVSPTQNVMAPNASSHA